MAGWASGLRRPCLPPFAPGPGWCPPPCPPPPTRRSWTGWTSSCREISAPCQNITCLNKLHKTCRTPRCFEGCSPLSVADAVLARLGQIEAIGTSHPMRITA